MVRDLDTQLLRTLIAIADSGGFARAAGQLHLTQSAISQQIKRLEEQTQASLFHRRGRGMMLTPAGEILLSFARRIIGINDEALAQISGDRKIGLVRLGIPEHFAETLLPRVLSSFSQEYCDVRLDVRIDLSAGLIRSLSAGELDLALILQEAGQSADAVLRREQVVWFAAIDFEARRSEPLPVVLFDGPCVFRAMVLRSLDEERIPWRNAYDSPSFASLRAAVRANLGVTGLLRSNAVAGLRIVDKAEGLPTLPESELVLQHRMIKAGSPARRLAEMITEFCRQA